MAGILLGNDNGFVFLQNIVRVAWQRIDKPEVREGYFSVFILNAHHYFQQMAVSSSPSNDKRVGIFIADDRLFGDEVGYLFYFCLTGIYHQLVVFGIGRYHTREIIFFQSSDAVHVSFGARDTPVPYQRFFVAEIGFPVFGTFVEVLLNVRRGDSGVFFEVWNLPR